MVTISLLYVLSENQATDTRGPPLPTYQSLDVHFGKFITSEFTTRLYGLGGNGIQLVSKCLLHQGLTQCTTWFRHEGEGFGPPLFDPGLDTVGPRRVDE